MKYKILSLCCLLAAFFGATAQTPMPLNPKVKSGVLPNGLSYYIMHNEEPKNRANFYIAQKVGSTLEEPTQLGLAHFLEHMAFNGTTNFPGKNMLNYLQSKGIRFGADINAYTSFDETVYNIDNVPTNDTNLMDSVLLVLHDWSGDILLLDKEINDERGVIQEEWRSRNTGQIRMYEAMLPKIYQEYQYQQMPIGKMDVIMNFDPEVLRAYYKKWYRPDQQGLVIVGDFDVDEMERKVIDLFSTIPMPENAAERTYPAVSDNEQPIYFSFTDPELTSMLTTISFKSEKIPFEFRNTYEVFGIEYVLKDIVSTLINTRLSERTLEPDCAFAYAGVNFGDYYVSKTKASFDVRVLAKNDSEAAVSDAMAVVARACKTGFTDSEYERACQELMAAMDKRFAEKDKTSNSALGHELCRHFIDNVPSPGIEMEYQLWQMILPQLNVEAANGLASSLLTDRNIVVVTAAPQADGVKYAAEETMLSNLSNAMHAEYEALVDEVITDPLIANLPAPGSIVNTTQNEKLGITCLTLSNGAKVVLKPTDFAGDEILLNAYRDGGKGLYAPSQAANVLMMEDAFEVSKMGNFDQKTLKKYLAGKNVGLSFSVNNFTDALHGSSTVKDLPYLFELIYTSFTNLNPDESAYNVYIDRIRPLVANQEKNPQTIFSNQIAKTRYKDNPLLMNPTVATLDNAVYSESLQLVKDVLSNAGEYTFIFTGNIDMATIKPLIEKYIASLPSKSVPGNYNKLDMAWPVGQIVNEFQQPMEVPMTMVFDLYSGNNLDYTVANNIMIELTGDILSNIFVETLREEEGGTYSPQVGANYNPNTGEWGLIYVFFTNDQQKDKLVKRADDEFMKILKNGVDEVNFNKVKEAMVKQYEINSKKNAYWNNELMTQLRFPKTPIIEDYYPTLQNITLSDFNKFLKDLYNGQNRIQVIMDGVSAQ